MGLEVRGLPEAAKVEASSVHGPGLKTLIHCPEPMGADFVVGEHANAVEAADPGEVVVEPDPEAPLRGRESGEQRATPA